MWYRAHNIFAVCSALDRLFSIVDFYSANSTSFPVRNASPHASQTVHAVGVLEQPVIASCIHFQRLFVIYANNPGQHSHRLTVEKKKKKSEPRKKSFSFSILLGKRQYIWLILIGKEKILLDERSVKIEWKGKEKNTARQLEDSQSLYQLSKTYCYNVSNLYFFYIFTVRFSMDQVQKRHVVESWVIHVSTVQQILWNGNGTALCARVIANPAAGEQHCFLRPHGVYENDSDSGILNRRRTPFLSCLPLVFHSTHTQI